ncbi:hypothetical protein [Lactobacillus corticis]|uniref:Polymerase n=1 Tax=Lactobacillus corticis TaxID=2201249 RepID=A0A916QJ49_9LACO|nr:hypothetical protein [Lactobacillus corticis]GFZ26170.1 hypothetical protein LCB40_00500 [Lactobacillus corticis]
MPYKDVDINEESFTKNAKFENFLLSLYGIVTLINVYSLSMFNNGNSTLLHLRTFLIVSAALITLLFSSFRIEKFFLAIIGIIFSVLSIKVGGADKGFLYVVLLIFAYSGISPRKILKVGIIATALPLFMVAISSKIGLISNLTFYRDGVMRQSLGTIYPLIFASYVFYIFAGLVILTDTRRMRIVLAFIIMISGIFVFKLTGARNDFIGMILLSLVSLLSGAEHSKFFRVILPIGSILIFALIFIVIFATQMFSYDSNVYAILNKLLSNRLDLQNTLSSYYNIKLLGQNIFQQGLGRTTSSVRNYFYIDSSFVRIIYMGGVLYFSWFMYLLIRLIKQLYSSKSFKFWCVLLIVMINGLTEDSFINYGINLMMPLFMISADMLTKEKII